MRPCVATALAASFVLCQVALIVFVFNTGERDLDAVLRPRVALLAGLRGNEVGGTEIIMRLARSLLTTELKGVLSRVTVLLIPRVNHDG